jgi:kynurenine formamidase
MNNNQFIEFMDKAQMYDLTMRLSVHTPPWPSYMPLGIQYFKRLAGAHMGQGANGQIITTSNHVGTHMDGEIHFYPAGRSIGNVPLREWVGPGVVVDISKDVSDYSLYTPKMITDKVEVKKGDILIINTGYHRYSWDQKTGDEIRYFVMHPGPSPEFDEWCMKMQIKWIGVDCGSADHPMNTIIRTWHPGRFQECDAKMKKVYGKSFDEIFSPQEVLPGHAPEALPQGHRPCRKPRRRHRQARQHPRLDRLLPLRGIELESSMCRIVAWLPPKTKKPAKKKAAPKKK